MLWDAAMCSSLHTHTDTPSSICTTDTGPTVINDWLKQRSWAVTTSSNSGSVFACWWLPAGERSREWGDSVLFIMSRCQQSWDGPLTHTGNGSAPSWMTKPSMTCVRTWGLTMAWGGLFSPFCGVLPVTVGDSLSFPEVMAGGGVPGAALGLLVEPAPDQQMNTTPSSQCVLSEHWVWLWISELKKVSLIISVLFRAKFGNVLSLQHL